MRYLKLAMLAAALLPLSSQASLGGAPGTGSATVQRATPPSATARATATTATATTTATAARAASAPASAAPYSVHQSLDANGVAIREYVLPSNVVFAVTWDGPIRPDMTALLGSYFPSYVSAGQNRGRGTGPLVEGSDAFRVESAGRLGRFYGMAWLPRLMPAGVRPGDLQ